MLLSNPRIWDAGDRLLYSLSEKWQQPIPVKCWAPSHWQTGLLWIRNPSNHQWNFQWPFLVPFCASEKMQMNLCHVRWCFCNRQWTVMVNYSRDTFQHCPVCYIALIEKRLKFDYWCKQRKDRLRYILMQSGNTAESILIEVVLK